MLAQCDLDLDARIGRAAQHFLHTRDRLAMRARRLDDLDDDDLPRLRIAARIRRDQQILIDAPVLGFDEPDAALRVDASDDLAIRALEHIDDLAFRPAAPVEAHALGA